VVSIAVYHEQSAQAAALGTYAHERDPPPVGGEDGVGVAAALGARVRVARQPPKTAAVGALDLQLSRLRKAIGPERILTHDGGYRLDVTDAVVDADRFSVLVADAANRPPSEAVGLLREALVLWRGLPFGELGDEEPLRAAAATLEDQRTAALEALFDAELRLGRDGAIVQELEALVAEHPLRERASEQLMLALYRCGRQADALRVYDELRRRLSEELGIAPGEGVRRLHEAIVRQDPSLEPRGDAPRTAAIQAGRASPREARALAAVLGAAMVVLVVVLLATGGNQESPASVGRLTRVPVAEERLAFIDLRRDRVLGSLPIGHELAEGNVDLAQGRDADWLAMGSGALLQIDRRRHRIANSTGLGFRPGGIGVGLGSVWVVAQDRPVLLRLEPRYGAVERRYRLPTAGVGRPDFFSGVAVAAGSVWVAQGEERVVRIDPRSGRTLARIRAPGATSLAGTEAAVWLSGGNSGVLYRIDPVANAVVTRVPLDPYLCCVAVGGGYVWAMNHRVWKLSSEGRVVSSIPIDGDGANLKWTGGAMWVSEGVSGQQTRIEPRDASTRTLRTGGLALHTAVRGDVAMVVIGDAPPDLLAGVRGPVARIELGPDGLQPDDPATAPPTAVPLWREQLLDATCARLLTLHAAPAPLGWTVASELAELPTSSDGRRWTFRLRPVYRFSPPPARRSPPPRCATRSSERSRRRWDRRPARPRCCPTWSVLPPSAQAAPGTSVASPHTATAWSYAFAPRPAICRCG
jgi:DNA-binding SARP family transcriptional activator